MYNMYIHIINPRKCRISLKNKQNTFKYVSVLDLFGGLTRLLVKSHENPMNVQIVLVKFPSKSASWSHEDHILKSRKKILLENDDSLCGKKKHEKISWKHLHPMKFWYRFDVCISLYFHIFMGFKSYYYKIKGITIHEPFMNHSWTSYWLSVPRVLGTAIADSTVGWLHEPWHNWWEPPSRFTRSFPSKSQSHLPSGNLTYLWKIAIYSELSH